MVREYRELNYWSFRSPLNAVKPLYLAPDSAEIAEGVVNELARIGLVKSDHVFTRVFECDECGTVVLGPQYRLVNRFGRIVLGGHSYYPPFLRPCNYCRRQKDGATKEGVCQGLERSDP